MRFDWIITGVALVMMACLSGCGVVRTAMGTKPIKVSEQERTFADSLAFLRLGSEQAAKDLLEKVVASAPVKGITDEAIFRLALLQLGDESSKGVQRASTLLNRLKSEYPRSIWTHQSAPLASYLTGTRILHDKQRELKTLKDLNLSLHRDNRDLRQTLERLKNLDLELEQKILR